MHIFNIRKNSVKDFFELGTWNENHKVFASKSYEMFYVKCKCRDSIYRVFPTTSPSFMGVKSMYIFNNT